MLEIEALNTMCTNCTNHSTCNKKCEAKQCLEDLIKSESDLFYKLTGVMWFVDKWLEDDELTHDEVARADIMREKTLRIVENLMKDNTDLKAALKNKFEEG